MEYMTHGALWGGCLLRFPNFIAWKFEVVLMFTFLECLPVRDRVMVSVEELDISLRLDITPDQATCGLPLSLLESENQRHFCIYKILVLSEYNAQQFSIVMMS